MLWVRLVAIPGVILGAVAFLLSFVDLWSLRTHVDKIGCTMVILGAFGEYLLALMGRENRIALEDTLAETTRASIKDQALAIESIGDANRISTHLVLVLGTFFWGFGGNWGALLIFCMALCGMYILDRKLRTRKPIEDVRPFD